MTSNELPQWKTEKGGTNNTPPTPPEAPSRANVEVDPNKYLVLCEVTETKGDKTSTNALQLFAKTPEEAFLKMLTAQSLNNKPNTSIKVVGTYVRTRLTVVDEI